MKRLMSNEPDKYTACLEQLGRDRPAAPFSTAEQAALNYADKLTREPGEIDDGDIKKLHRAGLNDGEILEVNQVAAYFAYANRTVTGLGVHTEGEKLGLAPEGEDWHHGETLL
jgi:uncharacterized peroxidase-related enzyme